LLDVSQILRQIVSVEQGVSALSALSFSAVISTSWWWCCKYVFLFV